jgi:phosphoadenosine phosphosulfate reductase
MVEPREIEFLNSAFESALPHDILHWSVNTYCDKLAVVTSFQPTGIVTLHMLSEIAPGTDVLTLDTGLLFPETYELMNTLERRLNLRLIRIHPAQTVNHQVESEGGNLWQRDPDRCCTLRKTIPLGEALTSYEAWITGLRRDQSIRRRTIPLVSWDTKYHLVKLSPLATWTEDMVWAYIHAHKLPYNPLHDQHYPSIGCFPCTQPVAPDGLDKRAGRWVHHDKTECGIHVPIPIQGES